MSGVFLRFYSLPLMHLLFQSAPASGYTSTGKCVRMKKKLKPEEEGEGDMSDNAVVNPLNDAKV